MKFAKELEREAVPEWRIKYLNYKAGKKYVKAVSRAIARATATPRSFGRNTPSILPGETWRPTFETATPSKGPVRSDNNGTGPSDTPVAPRSIPTKARDEGESLTDGGNKLSYGSFVATPPSPSPLARQQSHATFELPDPALTQPEAANSSTYTRGIFGGLRSSQRSATFHGEPPVSPALPRRPTAGPVAGEGRLRSLISYTGRTSLGGGTPRWPNRNEVAMRSIDAVRDREREFYEFLDSELDKVESFYLLKEKQAEKRLALLKEQLHEMRNRRIQEITASRQSQQHANQPSHDGSENSNGNGNGQDKLTTWVQPLRAKMFPPGPNSKSFRSMPQTPQTSALNNDAERDYIRRPEKDDVSYRTAKRKLKLALQEFYRSLELLKSYALLNRTAFRKLNKKFDKAVNARPPYRYTNEKVNKAWFVNSDVLEGQIRDVEDLYARYFERGNHKLAAGKLRSLARKPHVEAGSAFLNGFLIGTGIVLSIQGLIAAVGLLESDDDALRARTSFLLQIYGGYFLMLLIFALICVDCYFWIKSKVNYPFIFEFDQRHLADWRRLAEFPSFFLLLFGIFLWMNFSAYRSEAFFIYYPVVLIAISVAIVFFPAPFVEHKSRKWFISSHGRLLLAGALPVEFRDFFLGDIYCSLTYATANGSLFFCLYANHWNNPSQCNSSHSRLMGFLTALPPILRFCQCIRRYRDTKNIFPHLVNCGKYTMSIMAAVTLSVYRIDGSTVNLGVFVTFATINAIYCSIWDLFMDFSLLQPQSRNPLLRDILALKSRWPYYVVMVIDPILRFSWIFYAIFAHNIQHSTIVSFLVALMEVLRRGVWTLFRVENEHCANVSQYKASRDVPLPYRIEPLIENLSDEAVPTGQQRDVAAAAATPQQQGRRPQQRPEDEDTEDAAGSSTAVASTLGTLRRRRDTSSGMSISRMIAEAHTQDFEKKRKPVDQDAQAVAARDASDASDDDDEPDSASL